MTTTRYPGNLDFHPVPPHCAECGQFVGDPVIWERNDNLDLPDTYTARCVDCATSRAMERYEYDSRDEARRDVLGAISG